MGKTKPLETEPQLQKVSADGDFSRRLLIAGGGPAGLSAAVYAVRAGLDVVLLADELGGYTAQTATVENYLGFQSIAGFELSDRFIEHVQSYESIEILEGLRVEQLEQSGPLVIAHLDDGSSMRAGAAIAATGSRHRRLDVLGEDRPAGTGVSYCAVCDGPMYAGEDVVVVGSGNSGLEAAIYLSGIANRVYVIEQRSFLTGDVVLQERLESLQKEGLVVLYTGTTVQEILGEQSVEAIRLRRVVAPHANDVAADAGELQTDVLPVAGVFVEAGREPNSAILDVKKTDDDRVLVDTAMRTSATRIFAAGDVCSIGPDQIVTAVAQGCTAALSAAKLLLQR